MPMRWWSGMALLGLALLCSAAASGADEEKEVPLPKLPAGAGKLDEDPPKTFTKTKSGLKYRILRKGQGKSPKEKQKVKMHFQGWTDDGKVFESTYRAEMPLVLPIDQRVIPGWREGIPLVSEGGMIELEVPSDLGYKARGFPPRIPPNATLHYIIELVEVQ